ncbi:hypothetical protein DQ04_07001050, partial [Trypanosoma grayi]|uniref:hypothetical protein n=1 Tax=Trypanosoma grayi TaxID=71804 RepID=UPI0004F46AF6
MQDDTSPPLMCVDNETLLRDVHRLLLDTSYTTAELLEKLGDSTPLQALRTPHSARRVTISEEVIVFNDHKLELLQLPPALSLLYYAAVAEAPTRVVPNLLHILEVLGEPEAPRARGNILYEEGMRKREETAKWRSEQLKATEDKELKACTFKPEISDSAKQLAPKGLQTFMEKCMEWKKAAAMRLQKKAAQDRINRGEDEWMAPWNMSDHSRKLLEQSEQRGKKWSKLWESISPRGAISPDLSTKPGTGAARRGTGGGGGGAGRLGFGAAALHDEVNELETLSFHPVTGAKIGDSLAALQHYGEGEVLDATQVTEKSDRSSKSLVEAYLQRVESDKERRKERLEKLRAYYAQKAKEQLYEKTTGQPLFEPNALPTVMKNGTRVSFKDLSREEQQELAALLRVRRQEYVLTRYLRAQREAQQGRPQRRTSDEIVVELLRPSLD